MAVGKWTFYLFQIDVSANIQYGFRYRFSDHNVSMNEQQRSGSPYNFYAIDPTAKVYWGAENIYTTGCNCMLQYVRGYLNYLALTTDEQISLALMTESGKLIKFKKC